MRRRSPPSWAASRRSRPAARSRPRCGARASVRVPGTWCCSRRRAPPTISSATSRIAAISSRRWSGVSHERVRRRRSARRAAALGAAPAGVAVRSRPAGSGAAPAVVWCRHGLQRERRVRGRAPRRRDVVLQAAGGGRPDRPRRAARGDEDRVPASRATGRAAADGLDGPARPRAGTRARARGGRRAALVARGRNHLPAQRAREDRAGALARAVAFEEAGADPGLFRGPLAAPVRARDLRRAPDAGAGLRHHRRRGGGHLRGALRRRRAADFAARGRRGGRAGGCAADLEVSVPGPARPDVPRSLARPARSRVPDGGVAARIRRGRRVRRRPRREPPEAVLPARGAHRFHPQHRRRGDRVRGRRRGAGALRRGGLARDQGCARGARGIRLLGRARPHAPARGGSAGERRHGAGAAPHQGHGVAVSLLRDVVGDRVLHRRGNPALRQRRTGRFPAARRRSAAMRLLVAGGGTGGHLFPGLALGEEVKTRHPRNDVLFVGSARGIEAREVPKAGYPLEIIDVGPLKRMGFAGLVRGLFRLPRALWQSVRILRRFDPDVVVGVGGYSSGPVVLAAWLLRRPTAIQEQNALPGFTNRTLGWFVDAIFIAFPQAEAMFPPRKTHLLGNPIRRAFLDNYLHQKAPSDRLGLFVTGGSQGAHALNLRVAEALELLAPEIGRRLSVLHQTGVKDLSEIAARYEKLRPYGLEAEAVAFIDD